jgi:hypothetical protein
MSTNPALTLEECQGALENLLSGLSTLVANHPEVLEYMLEVKGAHDNGEGTDLLNYFVNWFEICFPGQVDYGDDDEHEPSGELN